MPRDKNNKEGSDSEARVIEERLQGIGMAYPGALFDPRTPVPAL